MQFCRVESEQTACLLTVQPFKEKRKRKLEEKKKRLLPTKQNKKQQNCTGFAFETGLGPILRKYWAAIEQSDWLI